MSQLHTDFNKLCQSIYLTLQLVLDSWSASVHEGQNNGSRL